MMAETVKRQGRLSETVALLAESPELPGTFPRASGTFAASTLDPLGQEVVIMTMATRDGCHVCVAVRTPRLGAPAAGPAPVAALRAGTAFDVPRWEALRQFTLPVLATAAAGLTTRDAAEVVLGIGNALGACPPARPGAARRVAEGVRLIERRGQVQFHELAGETERRDAEQGAGRAERRAER
jgi:hypothetical protein